MVLLNMLNGRHAIKWGYKKKKANFEIYTMHYYSGVNFSFITSDEIINWSIVFKVCPMLVKDAILK